MLGVLDGLNEAGLKGIEDGVLLVGFEGQQTVQELRYCRNLAFGEGAVLIGEIEPHLARDLMEVQRGGVPVKVGEKIDEGDLGVLAFQIIRGCEHALAGRLALTACERAELVEAPRD